MTITKFLLGMILLTTFLSAQSNKPCDDQAASQFDFWIGNWELTWENQHGKEFKGTNEVKKILGGCVIEENFHGQPSGLIGKSVSVYSPRLNKWLQTWVDNNGSYLDFEGSMIDDKMVLSRSFIDDNDQEVMQRMIFYNIAKDSFDWDWERSIDGGDKWELRWKIHYKRKM